MTADDLRALLAEVRALTEAGDFGAAREMLAAIEAREAAGLGPATALGLPRPVHAARLRLAKREGDPVARIGYQYTLVPPPDCLACHFAQPADRAAEAAAARMPVPRAIHQIWIGTRSVPATVGAWAAHARARGLTHRLWREGDFAAIGAEAHPAFAAMRARGDIPGMVDVARYLLLSREGGVYLDCDWYPARSDQTFHDRFAMAGLVAMAEDTPRMTGAGSILLANSFIAAPPAHPAILRLLSALPAIIAGMPRAPAWWATGPLAFTLAARAGQVALADAGLVAGSLPPAAPEAEAKALAQANEARDGGLLIAWKPWAA